MPKLSELSKTKTITLPDSNIKVVVLIKRTFQSEMDVLDIESATERGYFGVMSIAKSWDLTDDDGNVLPITRENLGKLSKDDGNVLLNYALTAFTEEKKPKQKEQSKT